MSSMRDVMLADLTKLMARKEKFIRDGKCYVVDHTMVLVCI